MSAPFDPYYHWLGIPPAEQPPNCYRLLGLQLYEPNGDVISNAADRLMMHLRTFQSGVHSAESQRLLNEISAARVRLLNPESKVRYDTQLQQQLQPAASPVQPLPSVQPLVANRPWPVAVPLTEVASEQASPVSLVTVSDDATGRSNSKRQSQRKSHLEFVKIIAGGVAGLIAATAILYFAGIDLLGLKGTSSPGPAVTQTDPSKTAEGDGSSTGPVTSTKDNNEGFATTIKPADRPPSTIASANPTRIGLDQPRAENRNEPEKSDKSGPTSSNPNGVSQGPPIVEPAETVPNSTQTARDAPSRKKLPPPSAEEQDEVKKQLEEIYKISATKTADEKLKVARELFKAASEIQDNPAQRFVVFRRAMDLALDAGDADMMIEAIDKLDAEFEVDPFKLKESTLARFAEKIRDEKSMDSLIAAAKVVIEQSVLQDKYDVAVRLAEASYNACQGTFGKKYRKFVYDGRNALKVQQKKWDDVQAALTKLETEPDDPESLLTSGHWLCFHKDQWDSGLTSLAKASDEKLRELAQRDLTQPTEVDAQVGLADAWHEWAKSGGDEAGADSRAYYWYLRAAGRATGLTRARVENGMADVEKRWVELVKNEVGRKPLSKMLDKPTESRPRDFADLARQGQSSSKTKFGPAKPPGFGIVDVLSEINTSRDTITGTWQRQGGVLITPQGVDDLEKGFKLKLPCEASPHYRLSLEITRVNSRGNLIIWLPAESGQKMAMLDGVKDNVPYSYVLGSSVRTGAMLSKGTTVKVTLQVQRDFLELTAKVGGKTVRLTGSKSGEQNANGAPPTFAIQSGGIFHINKIELETLP